MKKLALPLLLLSAFLAKAQTKVKDTLQTSEIEEVTMTKKVFERKSDRFVYDVASSPVAKGNTAFGLLKETPLVSTTDDQTLKIVGKSNAQIYINGRRSNMSADAVIELLKNTPAENISKIEVITTPGSEYNVESSEGIINIILKKKLDDGVSGNFRMSNNQAKTNRQSAAFTLNARKNKMGISASLMGRNWTQNQDYVLENGTPDFKNVSVGPVDDPNLVLGGYLNMDYELKDNQNLALSFNSFANKSYGSTAELFNTVTRGTGTFYSRTLNVENARSYNNSLNLNYELRTDDEGSKLNVNAAYLNFKRFQRGSNESYLSNKNQELLDLESRFRQNAPQIINNLSATADYIQKFKGDFTASMGGNISTTKTDNDTFFETLDLNSGNYIKDENQSNHFVYEEQIGGVYLTAEKKFSDKFNAKIGARLETTSSKGEILNSDLRIDRDYTNILPYGSLSYALTKDLNFSYSFSSRVRRPSFWEMNPVRIYLTPTNYIQNNPFVKASDVYNHEFTYMLKQSYFLVASHSISKNDYSQVPLQNGEELRYIRTNYGDKYETSFSLGMQKSFFKGWLNSNASTGVQINKVDAYLDTDPITGDKFDPFTINTNTTSFFIQTNNTLQLNSKKNLFLGANFFYIGSQILNIGTLSPISSLDLSLKKIWNDWTFNLQFRDVLNQNVVTIKDLQSNGNYNNVYNDQFNRSVELSITYNFGNKKVKKIREIKDASSEAKSRTN